MHIPPHNAELRPHVLQQFIRDNPLGILTTALRSTSHPFLQASHIPWVVDFSDESRTKLGKLRGHIARQNPQAKAIMESLSESSSHESFLQEDVLVMFNGPVHHYVTPKFYTDTKPSTGKVVPTWNYEAVQVYGRAKIYHDSKCKDFSDYLDRQIFDLSQHAETSIMGFGERPGTRAWEVADAPVRYIEMLKKNLIGIEIEIEHIAGRFKMSQEKPKGDRDGVIEGFRNLDSGTGIEISQTVVQRAAEYDDRKQTKQTELLG